MPILQKIRDELESAETLRRLYWEKKLTLEEISDRLGVSKSTVKRRMERHGIPRRNRSEATSVAHEKGRYPASSHELEDKLSEGQLRELYWGREMSLSEIADELGIHQTTVYRYMERYDISRRPDGGWWQDVERVQKRCEVCGEEFEVKLYREETARFCSPGCHDIHQRGNRIEKECEECGATFQVRPCKSHRKFCSGVCALNALPEGSKLRDGEWLRDRYWTDLLSIREIARVIGRGYPTVKRYLRVHGIDARSSRDGTRLRYAKENGTCKGMTIDEILGGYDDFNPGGRKETSYERVERLLRET